MPIPKVAPQLVPQPTPHELAPGIRLIAPISRKGHGPGLIVVVDQASSGFKIESGIPSPAQKWAEEGFCVVEWVWPTIINSETIPETIKRSIDAQKAHEKCSVGELGLVCYDEEASEFVQSLISTLKPSLKCVVQYSAFTKPPQNYVPTLSHSTRPINRDNETDVEHKSYEYPDQTSSKFALPFSGSFDYAREAVSHTRSLTFVKKHLNGPYFDLEDIWDEHTYYEFEDRNVQKTMNTMVQEPYVNHIPTLTGGIGREALTAFYRDHFIFKNPQDAVLDLISRTVGIDRIVDEFIFKCTHDLTIDWLLPGIPPTGSQLEIPMMAVVNLRGDRLYHEHITWDHASALRQIGCLPDYLPVRTSAGADGVEVRVPAAGLETAAKLRDKNAVPSNEMFAYGPR